MLVLGFLCCFVFVCERPEDGFACHSARAEVVFSPAGPFEDRGPVWWHLKSSGTAQEGVLAACPLPYPLQVYR